MTTLFKRLIALVAMALFVFVGITFGKLNAQSVTVDYFFFTSYRSISESLALFFFAGLLLGALAMMFGSWVKLRRKVRELKADLAQSSAAASNPAADVQKLEKPASDSDG